MGKLTKDEARSYSKHTSLGGLWRQGEKHAKESFPKLVFRWKCWAQEVCSYSLCWDWSMHLPLYPWDRLSFNRLGFHREQLNAPPDGGCFPGRLAAPARAASSWGRSVVSAAGKSPVQGVHLSCTHTCACAHTHTQSLSSERVSRREEESSKTYLTVTSGWCCNFSPSQPVCYSWSSSFSEYHDGNWSSLPTQAFAGMAETRTKLKTEGAKSRVSICPAGQHIWFPIWAHSHL